MVFVLIAPSDPARRSLEAAISRARQSGKKLNAFELHSVLISSLQENWRLYIRELEQVLKEQVCFWWFGLVLLSNLRINSQIV
jgi:hypothetical protein